MKKILFSLMGISLIATACNSSNAQAEFKVWGNCGMCEETIESSLKVDGVSKASWDKKTKMIKIDFDSTKIKVEDLHKKIAGAGYDTERETADAKTYDGLHECCKYKRKDSE